MRILLTNDDGLFAPGLRVLEEIAGELSDDVWVVAPQEEQSGQARAVTLNAPVRLREEGTRRFSVSGTPSDAVLLGVLEVMKDRRPDLILSGVNRGQNLAEDTSQSGTVAGAVQGMHLGVPAIALSQSRSFRSAHSLPWETARYWGPRVVRQLLAIGWPADVVLNVNFPDRSPDDVSGIEVTRQGSRDEAVSRIERRTDLRGGDYYWIGYAGRLSDPPAGTDLRAVYDGRISVTPLQIDLTAHGFIDRLRMQLASPGAPSPTDP
jgi:5'-nucleotidase